MEAITTIDNAPWHEALRAGQLLAQRCTGCGQLRHYPRPMCPHCHAMQADWVPLGGGGRIHSWTCVHHSILPGFADAVPYTLVTVDLDEGGRLVGLLAQAEAALVIGMRVRISVQLGPTGAPMPICSFAGEPAPGPT